MTAFTKLAQEKLAKTRQTKLVKSIEKKLPFEMKEEVLKEIAKNVIERAKQIREGLKADPMGTVKNYRSLLDVQTLAPAKKKKSAKKSTLTAKKALKKAKTTSKVSLKNASKSKKAIH